MYINEKTLKILTENEPEHFFKTWSGFIPLKIRLIWLKNFIKKDLSIDEFLEFMDNKGWYSDVEEYKKSSHYKIVNKCLEIDIMPYYNNLKGVEFKREFKIWQLNRI